MSSKNYEILRETLKNTAIIRGQWYNNKGKLKSLCYGTAFALSKRIILTCAHAVYSETKKQKCDRAVVIFNHSSGLLPDRQKIYQTADIDYMHHKELGEGETFATYPIPQDIALLYLSEDIDIQTFPNVGISRTHKSNINDFILAGYPSQQYWNNPKMSSINFKRTIFEGKDVDISHKDVLYHHFQTKLGHSGSAIIGVDTQTNKPTILGIHTHKGKEKNSGVYLNEKILERLANYQLQFAKKHKQYVPAIKFPQKKKVRKKEILDMVKKQEENKSVHSSKNLNNEKRTNEEIIEDETPLVQKTDVQQIKIEQVAITDELHKDELYISAEDSLTRYKMKIQQIIQQLPKMNKQTKEITKQFLQFDRTMMSLHSYIFDKSQNADKQAKKQRIIKEYKEIQLQLNQLKTRVLAMKQFEVVNKIGDVFEYLRRLKEKIKKVEEQDKQDNDLISFYQMIQDHNLHQVMV